MNENASDNASTDGAGMILLVDDDKTFCQTLSAALRRREFKVVVAHGYDDALQEAHAWSPGRAVVDLRMPGKGGLETIAALRKDHPSMRIVVLTGYGSIATAVEAMKLGAVHYLSKPTTVEEILAAFDRTEPALEAPPREPGQPTPLDELEWEHLQRVLTDCGGNISEAARRLGIHRRSLQRKLSRGRPIHDGSADDLE